jgi:pimeloyl-ACP methyl ester carboxylesterase
LEYGTREIRAPDGRQLSVWVGGKGDEYVFIHAGTPETGQLHDFDIEVAGECGFTCVGYSRPGYPNSDRLPGRRIVDCAGDVLAIANALGIDSFFTVGRSGGGGHALACAARLDGRVRAAVTVGSSAPRQADGLDWYAGMAVANQEEFGAAEAGAEASREYLEREAARWLSADPDDVPALFGDRLSDRAVQDMTQDEKLFSLEAMRRALGAGIWGWWEDDMAWISDWGFDPASIAVPVAIWHAGNDKFIPPSHGEWLAGQIPGASLHIELAEEHMSLSKNAYGEMLDRLRAAG